MEKQRFSSLRTSIILTLVLATITASAEWKLKKGDRLPPVELHLAASASEQIRYATALLNSRKSFANEEERFKFTVVVMTQLWVVPQRWPNDTENVLRSYEMYADLGLSTYSPRNAAEALHKALPISEKTLHHPGIERRLGTAYDMLADYEAAERHFVAAEESPEFRRLTKFERREILKDAANFFSRQGRARDAMRRHRDAADLAEEGSQERAGSLLFSLQEAVHLKDDRDRYEAKRQAKEVERAIAAARAKDENGKATRTLNGFEYELKRLRDQHRLH